MPLILPYHVRDGVAREKSLGEQKIGTTGRRHRSGLTRTGRPPRGALGRFSSTAAVLSKLAEVMDY